VEGNNRKSTLNKALVSENESLYNSGGGIFVFNQGYLKINNSTITSNHDFNSFGGIYSYEATSQLINSICWDNNGAEMYLDGNNNFLLVSHSIIEGSQSGIYNPANNPVNWLNGNLDQDPLFMNPDTSNFSLQYDSPCIDAGTTLVVLEDDTLYQAVPGSYIGFAPDMGAHEFDINEFYLAGDVNEDFQIDVLDAVMLVQIILGEMEPIEYQIWAADLNHDFNIDVLDIVVLVGLIIDNQ